MLKRGQIRDEITGQRLDYVDEEEVCRWCGEPASKEFPLGTTGIGPNPEMLMCVRPECLKAADDYHADLEAKAIDDAYEMGRDRGY